MRDFYYYYKFLLFTTLLLNLFKHIQAAPKIPEEMQELIDQVHNTCVAETGTKEEFIPRARNGDFEDDENFKCYFKCIFDQMACVSDDGILDIEAIIALLPGELSEKLAPTIRKCGNPKGSSPCDNVYLANICYQKNDPDNYFLP